MFGTKQKHHSQDFFNSQEWNVFFSFFVKYPFAIFFERKCVQLRYFLCKKTNKNPFANGDLEKEKKKNEKIKKGMAVPGFEPGSSGSQPLMLTTTLYHQFTTQ